MKTSQYITGNPKLRIFTGVFLIGLISILCVFPNRAFSQPKGDHEIWDLQFIYEIENPSQAITWDGEKFYLAGAFSSDIRMYDTSGNYLGFFNAGISPVRDLAWDGNHLFVLSNSNLLYEVDVSVPSIINTIMVPVSSPRCLAYDHQDDAFWIGEWGETLMLVDKAGSLINMYTLMEPVYGVDYDDFGELNCLWLLGNDGNGYRYFQLDLSTGTPTGLEHFIGEEFGYDVGCSGLYVEDNVVFETTTIGGIVQTTPPQFFGYELYPGPPVTAPQCEYPTIHIFPNPARSILKIKTGKAPEAVCLRNLSGVKILNFMPPTNEIKLELTGIPPGIYFIEIKIQEKKVIEKVLLQ